MTSPCALNRQRGGKALLLRVEHLTRRVPPIPALNDDDCALDAQIAQALETHARPALNDDDVARQAIVEARLELRVKSTAHENLKKKAKTINYFVLFFICYFCSTDLVLIRIEFHVGKKSLD